MERSGNPWIVYPGDVIDGSALIHEGRVFVAEFVFTRYEDPEHRCTLADRHGTHVFNVRGTTNFDAITICPGSMPINGLYLIELQSGVCQIFIR